MQRLQAAARAGALLATGLLLSASLQAQPAPAASEASGAADAEAAQAASAAAPAAAGSGTAAAPASAPGSTTALQRPVPQRSWTRVSRIAGRLRSVDLGLVINSADPASVAVGEHYIAARNLTPEQVLRIDVPLKPVLTKEEFERLQRAIDNFFGLRAQALALAWNQPFAVECNAITGALGMGYDAELCQSTCGASRPSRYFNSISARPYSEYSLRPAMLLAARTVDQAKAMIDRGVASDASLLRRGRSEVNALMLSTDDAARRVRQVLYPPAGVLPGVAVDVQLLPESALPGAKKVLMVITGSVRPPLQPAPEWVPGGIGDHLTSLGGQLHDSQGQGTVFDWIASGATASHGSVSEPCNHLQKFPHPQVLLGHYLQGATVIEAYWKSVAWPQQSLFVGEPLAAPFSRR